jgi:phosphate uptake regulator
MRTELDSQLQAIRLDLEQLLANVEGLWELVLSAVEADSGGFGSSVRVRKREIEALGLRIEGRISRVLTIQQPVWGPDLRVVRGAYAVLHHLLMVAHGAELAAEALTEFAGFAPALDEPLALLQEIAREARSLLHDAVVALWREDVSMAQQVLDRCRAFDLQYRMLPHEVIDAYEAASCNGVVLHHLITRLMIAYKLDVMAGSANVISKYAALD